MLGALLSASGSCWSPCSARLGHAGRLALCEWVMLGALWGQH